MSAAPLDPAMVEAGARALHKWLAEDYGELMASRMALASPDRAHWFAGATRVLSAALFVGGFHQDDDCPNADAVYDAREMQRDRDLAGVERDEARAETERVVADRDALRVRVEELTTENARLRERYDALLTDFLRDRVELARARVSVPPKDEETT
jgi:hypothetical protein